MKNKFKYFTVLCLYGIIFSSFLSLAVQNKQSNRSSISDILNRSINLQKYQEGNTVRQKGKTIIIEKRLKTNN